MEADGFSAYARSATPRLRRHALMLCGDTHEADDLVQDTLAAAYQRWPALTVTAGVDAYLRTALTWMFLSSRRRLRCQREILCALPPDQRQDNHELAELRVVLQARLARLPPGQRMIIVLRFWEDLSIGQTASALGISPGTVASQSHKALATLRRNLADLR
jgi:RNA polymerase sigma-70 factor (sigma-E family)